VEELFSFEDSIICVESTFAAKVTYKGKLEGKNILPSRLLDFLFYPRKKRASFIRFSVSAAMWQQFHHWARNAGCLHYRPCDAFSTAQIEAVRSKKQARMSCALGRVMWALLMNVEHIYL
jgi:hypothetical protein